MPNSNSWGQLVSLTDYDSPPYECVDDKFCIGRALGK